MTASLAQTTQPDNVSEEEAWNGEGLGDEDNFEREAAKISQQSALNAIVNLQDTDRPQDVTPEPQGAGDWVPVHLQVRRGAGQTLFTLQAVITGDSASLKNEVRSHCPTSSSPHKCSPPFATPAPCPACPTPQKCPPPCASPPPCPACPSCTKPTALGYDRYPGHGAYKLHPQDSLNWFDANATCEREGAHLAIIDSKEEENLLASILRNHGTIYVSIGFHDLYSEGDFYTVLGKPLRSSGYTNWGIGEPNNRGNEDCGGLTVSSMTLNDHNCNEKLAFICEMP